MGTMDGALSTCVADVLGGPAAFLVDARGLVSAWSPAAERLLGYATAEVVGRPVAELSPPHSWDSHQRLLPPATGSVSGDSIVLLHRQGHLVPVTFSACSVASSTPGSEQTVILATVGLMPGGPSIGEDQTVQSRLHRGENLAAVAMRRRLETTDTQQHSAAEITRSYLPARSGTGVNGSWVDVIPLSGARLAFVAGDIPVSGMQATVCIGLMGAAVRALSELDLAPEEVLARLDDIVSRYAAGESDEWSLWFVERLVGTTCLYAVYDPITRRCVMASAGHPPPAIVDLDGLVRVPELPDSRPLGRGEPVFEPVDVTLAEGSTLLFHSGSLARACSTNDAATELLRTVIQRGNPSIENVCRATADIATPLLPADDDLSLLVARTRALSDSRVATWDLPRDPAAVADMRSLIVRQLHQWDLDYLDFATELIASELVTNAIRYGRDPMRLRLIHEKALICEVLDGSSAAPHIRLANTTDEGGRGLLLVAECSRCWGVRYTDQGKIIWAEQSLTSQGMPEDLSSVMVDSLH
ncbi:SpoIIE family protein phosphatase [Streptomyces sp. NPDC002306]